MGHRIFQLIKRIDWIYLRSELTRAALIATAALLVASAVGFTGWLSDRHYQLDADTLSLIGDSDPALVRKMSFNVATQSYLLNGNPSLASCSTGNPVAGSAEAVACARLQSSKIGQKKISGDGNYGVSLPVDVSRGISYTDKSTGLSFALIPQFHTSAGREVNGHIVYPLGDNQQSIYTLKSDGLKEDIIVPKTNAEELSFSYKLVLPSTLQARLLGDGRVGVYSADPALFGNISFGSGNTDDQAAVMKARVSGPKTNLVFSLPAPVIKDVSGKEGGSAKFELNSGVLSVIASRLQEIDSPFTIDPSVIVASASNLATGNNDGNISFDSSGNANRSLLTGGSLGSGWTNTTTLSQSNVAVSGGYVYDFGNGASGYASIGTGGPLGVRQSGPTMPSAYSADCGVAYNRYLYSMGGYDGSTGVTTVYVSHINVDGSIGGWTTTTSLPATQANFGCAAYNGYLYITGGDGGGGALASGVASVYFAPIKADGTLGAWNATASMSAGRRNHRTVAYNGFLYAIGGQDSSSTVSFAPINADGTLDAWTSTSNPSVLYTGSGVQDFGAAMGNGYVYIIGGRDNPSSGNNYNNVSYAPIYANGALGAWRSTATGTSNGQGVRAVFYNNYVYVFQSSSVAQYAKVDPPGQPTSFTTTGATSLPANRGWAASAVYNGYLYILGGSSGASFPNSRYNDVVYAPLNRDGTVGAWTSSPNTFTGGSSISDAAAVVYNGYLYYLGGYKGTGVDSSINTVQYSKINGDGSIGAWTNTTSMPTGKRGLVAWAYNGYLYEAAGWHYTSDTACNTTANTYCSDVWYAPISASGTIGSWSATNSLLDIAVDGMVAVNGSYVYFTGGDGSTTTVSHSVIQFTQMKDGGGVISWGINSSSTYRSEGNMAAHNGYLYTWGSKAGSADIATVSFAKLDNDGTVADDSGCGAKWCVVSGFSASVAARAGVIYDGYIYAYGGNNGTTGVTTGEFAVINNGGSGAVSTWTTGSRNFSGGRCNFGSVAYGGYLYVMGGYGSSGLYDDVQYAKINNDGSIGAWQTTTNLPTPRDYFNAIAYDGYIYVVGGTGPSGTLSDVQYAKINNDGSIGAWQTTNNLITGVVGYSEVAYNGFLYVLGGGDGAGNYFNTVQYAPIKADGSLGTWQSATSFTNGRDYLGSVVYGGNIYIVGGWNGSTDYSDVQYASVAADGSLGTWQRTTSFTNGRDSHSVAVSNGYLYIAGGTNSVNDTFYNDVQYASIGANGSLGTWQSARNTGFSIGRAGFGAQIVGGYMYVFGGSDGSNYQNDIQYTSLASIAQTGRYSKLIDLSSTINGNGGGDPLVVEVGAKTTSISGGTLRVCLRAASGTDNTLGELQCYNGFEAGSIHWNQFGRYAFMMVMLDDSTGGMYPDASATSLTEIDLRFRASPDRRLRGGKGVTDQSTGQIIPELNLPRIQQLDTNGTF